MMTHTHKQLFDYLGLFKDVVSVRYYVEGDIPLVHPKTTTIGRLRKRLLPRNMRDEPVNFADEFGTVYEVPQVEVKSGGVTLQLSPYGELVEGQPRPTTLTLLNRSLAEC